MKKLTPAMVLLALGAMLLASAPAHAAVAGSATFVCGVGGVVAIGGTAGGGSEFNSLSLPTNGTPLVATVDCSDEGSVELSFDAADGAALNLSNHGEGTLTIAYDDGGLVTGATIEAGGGSSELLAVGAVVAGVGTAVVVG